MKANKVRSPGNFKIPERRNLQRHIVIPSKNMNETAKDYIKIQNSKNDMRAIRGVKLPTYNLDEVEAIKKLSYVKNINNNLVGVEEKRQIVLEEALVDLDDRRNYIENLVSKTEKNYMSNCRKRIAGIYDLLSKIKEYMTVSETTKREKDKQTMLLNLDYAMNSLLVELEPYEKILGRLGLQDITFKSKADTLVIMRNILSDMRKILNIKFQEALNKSEDTKKELFHRIFNLRDGSHRALNRVMALQEIDVKSQRIVLELESKLAVMRERANHINSECAEFYWFLDWVLKDVLGIENVAGITLDSTPQEKTQAIIHCYKNLKKVLNKKARAGKIFKKARLSWLGWL